MEERTRSAIIVLVAIVVMAIAGFGYNMYSARAIQALHDRYDVIIEAHVLIPPATASTLGQGHFSEAFTANASSIEFGIVLPGTNSALMPLVITSTGLLDNPYIHVATDLNIPGVTLTTGETKDLYTFTRRVLNVVGITYRVTIKSGFSQTPAFRIEVAPNTAGMDLTFHIIISYSYCGGI